MDTGWIVTDVCVNDTSSGAREWVSDDSLTALVGNEVSSNNGTFAGIVGAGSNTSNILKCTISTLDDTDIAPGSPIDGVEVRISRSGTLFVVQQTIIKLCLGGTVQGSDFGDSSVDWPSSEASVEYGSSSQLGGLAPTQTQVVSGTFGVGIQIVLAANRVSAINRTHLVDIVEMKIHFSDPPAVVGSGGFFFI